MPPLWPFRFMDRIMGQNPDGDTVTNNCFRPTSIQSICSPGGSLLRNPGGAAMVRNRRPLMVWSTCSPRITPQRFSRSGRVNLGVTKWGRACLRALTVAWGHPIFPARSFTSRNSSLQGRVRLSLFFFWRPHDERSTEPDAAQCQNPLHSLHPAYA